MYVTVAVTKPFGCVCGIGVSDKFVFLYRRVNMASSAVYRRPHMYFTRVGLCNG